MLSSLKKKLIIDSNRKKRTTKLNIIFLDLEPRFKIKSIILITKKIIAIPIIA